MVPRDLDDDDSDSDEHFVFGSQTKRDLDNSQDNHTNRTRRFDASRRRLLQLLGVGSAALGLSGMGAAEPTPTDARRRVGKASDIQPAIDDLADPARDQQGGVVELEPGVYEPETTIWLKAGVTLAGRGDDGETVLSTADLGYEATFHHNGDRPHPHYPVVANYRTPPLELDSRDPTEEEEALWGHNVGLRDIVIDAGAKQRWSTEDTYFGVYDGVVFSRSKGLRLHNVETRNFLGYGGFINGCRGVRDIGSKWQGGATDYHCNALTLHTAYPPDPTIYTTGVFDVEVVGPPPTMETFAHDLYFVSEGASAARIEATDPVFLGSEAAYYNGDAPLTDPDLANYTYHHDHGRVEMEGYTIDGGGHTGGILNTENRTYLRNCTIVNGSGAAFRQNGRGNSVVLTNCRISGYDVGLSCFSFIPHVDGLDLTATTGIDLSGHANRYKTLDDIRFDCAVGVRGTNNEPVILNRPDFSSCEIVADPGFDGLIINDPVESSDNVLTIDGQGSYASYTFTVSGTLEAKTGIDGEDEDSISGATATGAVGRDSYVFSGELEDISVDGDAAVILNGERLDSST